MGAAASITGPEAGSIVDEDYREKLKGVFTDELSKIGLTKMPPPAEFAVVLAGREKAIQEAIALSIPLGGTSTSTELTCIDKIRQRVSYTFVCAVDGSDASDVAFETSLSLLRRQDHLCMFHTYCDTKNESLPGNLKSPALRGKYDAALLSRFPKERYSFLWERRNDRAVKDVLLELMNMYKVCGNVTPDFLVMGYTGRKGISKTEGPTTCGSNTDFTMRHLNLPCIIVKGVCAPGAKTYVMAVNRSVKCREGLDLLFGLMAPRDKVIVVSVDDGVLDEFGQNKVNEVKAYYGAQLAENASAESCFQLVQKEGTVGDSIIRAVNEIGPDFCGIAPRAKEYSGSFTEQIILGVKSSIILCKS